VYNVAPFRVIAQQIGNYLAKGLWVKAFVYQFNGIVYILFLARNASQCVFIVHSLQIYALHFLWHPARLVNLQKVIQYAFKSPIFAV